MSAKVIGGWRIGMSQSWPGAMIGQASLGRNAAQLVPVMLTAGSCESAGFCC